MQDPPDTEVQAWLQTLRLESLCQWDVLVFLYRHQATLVGAEYLAGLLGYATERVVTALDILESLGLIDRSRVSQGARLYQFTVSFLPPHGEAFARLLALADHRAGRLLLSKQLRQAQGTPLGRLQVAGQAVRVAQPRPQQGEERRKTWLKAI